ncbi:MAG: pentapeptide repeat-containing protein [Candidatus Omnitrophica bacterium]|nr:pentapeptide repeat-containing protein [Candidatus Omnitrophota bacterium]
MKKDIVGNLEKIPSLGEYMLFSDQKAENITVCNSTIMMSRFVRLGLKNASFENCNFTQSLFVDTYFRKAKFKNVSFTGSQFKYCNFDKASFQCCDLRYCSFYYCKLPKDEIISCLPNEANLRKTISRNLRANFEMLGDRVTADVFLDIEIAADEEELKAILLYKTQYYKQNYNFGDRFNALLRLIVSKFSGFAWGYGHRLGLLVRAYLMTTIICSLLLYIGKLKFLISSENSVRNLGLVESVYLAFSKTVGTTIIAATPVTFSGKIIVLGASFIGAIFLALLAATLYRKIAR